MDELRSSSNAHDMETHDNIVSTIAHISLQIVDGISKVCAEQDNQNSSADQLPPVLPLIGLCTLVRPYFLFATPTDPPQAKVFGCIGGKN